jgi:hypothetical protein
VKRNVPTVGETAVDLVRPAVMAHPPGAREETVPGPTAGDLAGLTEGLSSVPVLAARSADFVANGRADFEANIADLANVANRRHHCPRSI